MNVLGIDPGPTESAYVIADAATCRPLAFGKIANTMLLAQLVFHQPRYDNAVIEMIYMSGMPAGAEVFDTCVWIGRFQQSILNTNCHATLTKRHTVKMHLCHDMRAKDGNIAQALADRFAYGVPNRGKGTKTNPGFFYGFAADIWQAFALAVTHIDTHPELVQTTQPNESDTGPEETTDNNGYDRNDPAFRAYTREEIALMDAHANDLRM